MKSLIKLFIFSLLIMLIYFETSFGSYIAGMIKVFSTGLSSFKIYYFLFFLLVASLWKNDQTKEKTYSELKIFSMLLLSLFIIGLAEHLYLLKITGADINDKISCIYKGVSAYTDLHHNHLGKTAMALLLNFIIPKTSLVLGYGGGFTDFVPSYLQFISLALLIALNFYGLRLIAATQFKKLSYYPIVFISIHCLSRLSVDGGFFDFTSILYQTVLIWILFSKILKRAKVVLLFYPLIPLSIHYFMTAKEHPYITYVAHSLPYMFFISLFSCLAYYHFSKKNFSLASLFLILLFFFNTPLYFMSSKKPFESEHLRDLTRTSYPALRAHLELQKDFKFNCDKRKWAEINESYTATSELIAKNFALKNDSIDLSFMAKGRKLFLKGKVRFCHPRTSNLINKYLYEQTQNNTFYVLNSRLMYR